jgi:hypothetical protein
MVVLPEAFPQPQESLMQGGCGTLRQLPFQQDDRDTQALDMRQELVVERFEYV